MKVLILLFAFFAASPFIVKGQNQAGFSVIKKAEIQDWVAFSPDERMLAIVHTDVSEDAPPVGKSLEIYSVDSSGKATTKIYEDRKANQLITELQWVGNSLLYSTIEGFASLDDYQKWLNQPRNVEGAEHMIKYVGTKIWNSSTNASTEWPVKFLPPGVFLPGAKGEVIGFDPLTQIRGEPKQVLNSRVIGTYDAQMGETLNLLRTNYSFPNYRWWGGPKNFLPLFVHSDSNQLILMVGSYYKMETRKYNVPLVIAVDLKTGIERLITPDSGINGLAIAGDPRSFLPGNPVEVKVSEAEELLACNLDLSEAGWNVVYRFGFFSFDGKLVREQVILDKQLKKNGVPLGSHLTWTPDGSAILFQAGPDVWLLDLKTLQGKRIEEQLLVEDVVAWIGSKRLLVRARILPVGQTFTTPRSLPMKKWGVLSIN